MNDCRKVGLAHYAVTIIGKDRPGIVADTAQVLFALGCNVEDSSCTMLGGEFAMILIVSHQKPFSKKHLEAEFAAKNQGNGLSAFIRSLKGDEVCYREPQGELCLVSVAEPVYVLMLEAALPQGMTVEDASALLEKMKKELSVEISVRLITPVSL